MAAAFFAAGFLAAGLAAFLAARILLHSLLSRGLRSFFGLGSSGLVYLLHSLWLLSLFERASGSNTLELLESARGDSLLDCCFCVSSDRVHFNLVIGEDLLLDGRRRSHSSISGRRLQ